MNVSTFRSLISFFFSSHAATWVQERGPLVVFGIYVGVLFISSGFIPIFFFFGKRFRLWTGGSVTKRNKLHRALSAETVGTEIQSLNRVMSMETVGSSSIPEKGVTKVTSMETVESLDGHLEHKRKGSL